MTHSIKKLPAFLGLTLLVLLLTMLQSPQAFAVNTVERAAQLEHGNSPHSLSSNWFKKILTFWRNVMHRAKMLVPEKPCSPTVDTSETDNPTIESVQVHVVSPPSLKDLSCEDLDRLNPNSEALGKGYSGTVTQVKVGDQVYAQKKLQFEPSADEVSIDEENRIQEELSKNGIGPKYYGFKDCGPNDKRIFTEPLKVTFKNYIDEIINDAKNPNQVKETAVKLIKQVEGVLSHITKMHSLNYFHNDLHTNNIMFTNTGEIKFIDFGRTNHRVSKSDEYDFTTNLDYDLQNIENYKDIFIEACRIRAGTYKNPDCNCGGRKINPLTQKCETPIIIKPIIPNR